MEQCTDDHINPLCSEKFDNIENGVSKILENQKIMHDKFFVDNGDESYQTFRRKTEAIHKAMAWGFGLFFAAIITTTVGILVTRVLS